MTDDGPNVLVLVADDNEGIRGTTAAILHHPGAPPRLTEPYGTSTTGPVRILGYASLCPLVIAL